MNGRMLEALCAGSIGLAMTRTRSKHLSQIQREPALNADADAPPLRCIGVGGASNARSGLFGR
ncbi:MAG: hypothetical protein AVDCRST_MAG91-3570 [uncultured Sphingomonadaceae bacterium]|uniref:Uncharacterized protein n=1 Tax=uncultured Sphingomonadaceae bacterium TaxID=169976 RepID=A0A6J4U275_9SPHN|nr:MAG: hypothetical protein AVDCRST_MAG91-3570 [uncultured Sphingomonadaceae bacterium]